MTIRLRTKSDRETDLSMLHRYYKWRYERRTRSGAFKLPKSGRYHKTENSNLSSYLSHSSGTSHGFRPFDLPRKRRKIVQVLAVLLILAILAWVTYESIIALALLGD